MSADAPRSSSTAPPAALSVLALLAVVTRNVPATSAADPEIHI